MSRRRTATSLRMVEALVFGKADPNKQGRATNSALMRAIRIPMDEVTQMFIVNALCEHKANVGNNGDNPWNSLHCCVYHGRVDLILFKFGANINAVADRYPKMMVSMWNTVGMVMAWRHRCSAPLHGDTWSVCHIWPTRWQMCQCLMQLGERGSSSCRFLNRGMLLRAASCIQYTRRQMLWQTFAGSSPEVTPRIKTSKMPCLGWQRSLGFLLMFYEAAVIILLAHLRSVDLILLAWMGDGYMLARSTRPNADIVGVKGGVPELEGNYRGFS